MFSRVGAYCILNLVLTHEHFPETSVSLQNRSSNEQISKCTVIPLAFPSFLSEITNSTTNVLSTQFSFMPFVFSFGSVSGNRIISSDGPGVLRPGHRLADLRTWGWRTLVLEPHRTCDSIVCNLILWRTLHSFDT